MRTARTVRTMAIACDVILVSREVPVRMLRPEMVAGGSWCSMMTARSPTGNAAAGGVRKAQYRSEDPYVSQGGMPNDSGGESAHKWGTCASQAWHRAGTGRAQGEHVGVMQKFVPQRFPHDYSHSSDRDPAGRWGCGPVCLSVTLLGLCFCPCFRSWSVTPTEMRQNANFFFGGSVVLLDRNGESIETEAHVG